MSIQICRAVELTMRSACYQTLRSRPCVHRTVLTSVGPACLCVPWVPVHHRRAYSMDCLSSAPGLSSLGSSSQQSHADKTPPSSAMTQRQLSAVTLQGQYHQPPSWSDFLDLGPVEQNIDRAYDCKYQRRFVVDPDLAKLVAQLLKPEDDPCIVLEINPGPAVLTKALLNAGPQRVVALETDSGSLLYMKVLEGFLRGQLQVLHCDFFKIDSLDNEVPKPPVWFSEKLLTHLGISEADWTDDIRVKVVGFLPVSDDRTFLKKILKYALKQLSIFRFGRVELNFFIKEREYEVCVATPGDSKRYSAFSVLMQMAFEIELLHTEPQASFAKSKYYVIGGGKNGLSWNGNVCLVRFRPRAELFSEGLTPHNVHAMIMMVKQCMAKRSAKLLNKLNIWSPESANDIMSEMGMPSDMQTGHVYPEEYMRLFQMMDVSQGFSESWFFEDILESQRRLKGRKN